MEHVLQLIPTLKRRYNPTQYHKLTSKLSSLPFLNVTNFMSGPRKAPQDLYDCSKPELQALFHGKELFPCPPFNCDEYISLLRDCNLRITVAGNALMSLIHENAVSCSNLQEPQKVGKRCFLQVKAVLDYIRKEPSVLDDIITFPNNNDNNCVVVQGQAARKLKVNPNRVGWEIRDRSISSSNNKIPNSLKKRIQGTIKN